MKTLKKTIIFFSLLFLALGLFSQNVQLLNRTMQWVIDYNPPMLIDFRNNNVDISQMNSSYGVAAGCSAISDINGNLLFFTNGEVVYNANGDAMPHGNNLGGSANANQGSLIIPHPGNSNLYYLFTTDSQIGIFTGGCGCVSYSLIDMQLDSGRGDVIDSVKAIQLYGPATSRLAGVLSKNSNTSCTFNKTP